MRFSFSSAWRVILGLLIVGGCSSAGSTSSSDSCTYGTDCPSGVCGGDGQCVDTTGPGGAAGASGSQAGGAGPGGASGGGQGGDDPGGSGQGGAAGSGGSSGASGSGNASGKGGSAGTSTQVCSPNNDGTITRQETPLAAGLKTSNRRALDAPVDTAGQGTDAKSKTWDFSKALENDTLSVQETQPVEGTWFASKFPGATYALKLSETSELRGVFKIQDDALLLMGVVSPTDGTSRTELTYATPVKILSFPITYGATWSTTTNVSGVMPAYEGAISTTVFFTEVYENKVDAAGLLTTPYSKNPFTALRINVLLTRTVGALITKTRTFAWSTECFGTIARAVSAAAYNGLSPGDEFTTAAEYTRLSP